jgi:F-type H+-transporting ATPase subunit a
VAEQHTSPLHQFEIRDIVPIHIGQLDLSFTNSSLFMLVAVGLVALFLVGGMSNARLVPGRLQSTAELFYEFIAGMVRDNVGHEGKQYFPFIFSLFMFILFGNLIGMVPYTFTFTSHIIVTFAMALVVFLGVTAIGIARHGAHFLTLFVPPGVPKVMLLLLVPIEIISYVIRPITLSVRLFANMMAGHTMLVIFAGFVTALGSYFLIPGLLPLAATTAFMFLEVLVAVLQAYVFTILTCIYLHDAIHLH